MKYFKTSVVSFALAKLKATRRVAGIIALVAIIWLSFVTYGGDDSDDNGGRRNGGQAKVNLDH
jgi:hypothetical protein